METKKTIQDITVDKTTIKKVTKISEENTIDRPSRLKIFNNINFRVFTSNVKTIYIILFILIIILTSVLVFMPSNLAKDSVEQAKIEAEIVKKQLSKHIVLPENNQIDIRKITSKVEDPFFQNAEIGDYLVIFYENRIALVYSVDKNIIVNAGVVFIDPKTATTTSTTSKTQ